MQQFADYVKTYVESFPGISISDFPVFEDIDKNGDGSVDFAEWQEYIARQKDSKNVDNTSAKSLGRSASVVKSDSQSFTP